MDGEEGERFEEEVKEELDAVESVFAEVVSTFVIRNRYALMDSTDIECSAARSCKMLCMSLSSGSASPSGAFSSPAFAHPVSPADYFGHVLSLPVAPCRPLSSCSSSLHLLCCGFCVCVSGSCEV